MTGSDSPARELRAAEALGFWECGKESALGGTVRIRSRKGTGTRITVMLPLPASTARHASRTDLLAGAGGFSSKYEGALEAQTNLSPANTHNVHQVHSS